MKKSTTEIGEQDFPVKWFKFIYPNPMTETSTLTTVHVAYSPIAFMNHQLVINLHDGYPLSMFCFQKSTSHPLFSLSFPTLCNLKSTMFHFGVDLHYSTTEPQNDLPSLGSPKGKMQVLSVQLVFSKVPHQAVYVLATLHLQSSIKSSCCVKLSFVSQSLILFSTPNSLLLQTLFSMFQNLPPVHTKFPTDTPT